MDYLSGGDLRYHICRNRRFTEEITRKCQTTSDPGCISNGAIM